MLIEAALNGGRTRDEHPAIPLSPEDMAAAAKDSVVAGARSIHFHVRSGGGRESVHPGDVANAAAAVRSAVPTTRFGVSTGAWILPDPEKRREMISRWNVLPDFASVNFKEEGAVDLAKLFLARGVGIEAGLSNVYGAEIFVVSGLGPRCLRVLLEPQDQDAEAALEMARAIESVLDRAAVDIPRLLHGLNKTAWGLIDAAASGKYETRVGFEDILTLPDGTLASSNAALVAEAVRRTARSATA
jgi:uncharacterized protein (DUF849 family)